MSAAMPLPAFVNFSFSFLLHVRVLLSFRPPVFFSSLSSSSPLPPAPPPPSSLLPATVSLQHPRSFTQSEAAAEKRRLRCKEDREERREDDTTSFSCFRQCWRREEEMRRGKRRESRGREAGSHYTFSGHTAACFFMPPTLKHHACLLLPFRGRASLPASFPHCFPPPAS